MRSRTVSPQGTRLLRDALHGSRGPLLRIAGWSVLEAAPALVAGWATAAALDRGFLAGRPLTGVAWLGLLAVLHVVRAAAERAMFPYLADVVEPLRDDLVRRLVRSALLRAGGRAWFVDAVGVTRLTRQAESVRGLVGTLLRTARPLAVTVVAAAGGLVGLDALLAAVVLPPFLLALAVFPLTLRMLVRRQRALVLMEERVTAEIGAVLTAGRDINALGAGPYAVAAVGEVGADYARATLSAARVGSVRILLVLVGGHLPLLLLLATGPWLIGSGRISTGELVGAATYLTVYLIPALQMLTGMVGGLWAQLGVTLTRLAEVIALPGPPAADGVATPDGHALAAERLTFSYGPHAEPVIREMSFTVAEGEHLAVVGASGIGKSTLAGLLAGLEVPDAGTVRFGGRPVGSLDERARCRAIALVPQEAYVFPGTLRENLTYLDPEATDADLRRTAHVLGLAPLMERLGGLDAELTDPAAELSSGERQLLVLARVYVSPARLVILDEAGCHLDPVAEARAEEAFAARPGTLVVIAHRIASARRAERILVLDGLDADVGTHAELLGRNPLYADLVGRWTPEVPPERPEAAPHGSAAPRHPAGRS